METLQRNANSAIPPWTEEWSLRRQLGFGAVSLIPLALLGIVLFTWLLSALHVGVPFTRDVLPLLMYSQVGATFITLLVFGHLMVANSHIGSGSKLAWGVAFLVAAPAAIPTYWLVHVWHDGPKRASTRSREVHVYDYDYTPGHAEGTERLSDGTVVHRVDATA